MKATILTLGSRGDVQPYVALARGLQTAGHDVTIGAEPCYRSFVEDNGVDYVPLGDRPDSIEAFDRFARLQHEAGKRAYKIIREANSWIIDLLEDQIAGCERAAKGADVLVEGTMGMITGHLAEHLGIPFVRAYLRPETRTRHHRRPDLVYPKDSRIAARNRFSYSLPMIAVWSTVRKPVNRWRAERGLAAFPPAKTKPLTNPTQWFHYDNRFPVMNGYSGLVAPRQPDYPEWHEITGFWSLDTASGYTPPPKLQEFLDAGPPPIAIGFGSMPILDPGRMWPAIIHAIEQTGSRAVVLSGWGGLDRRAGRDDVEDPDRRQMREDLFVVEAVPHDWLYPRCAMAIHHGGSGAASASMHAGIPTIVVPFLWDQLFWGRRAHALGIGPAPIPQPELTAESLADAIRAAQTPSIRKRAAAVGAQLRDEDGIARAVELLERTAARPRQQFLSGPA